MIITSTTNNTKHDDDYQKQKHHHHHQKQLTTKVMIELSKRELYLIEFALWAAIKNNCWVKISNLEQYKPLHDKIEKILETM
jgi:hypothetical protein